MNIVNTDMHMNHACAQGFHTIASGLKWKRKPLDLVEVFCRKVPGTVFFKIPKHEHSAF